MKKLNTVLYVACFALAAGGLYFVNSCVFDKINKHFIPKIV